MEETGEEEEERKLKKREGGWRRERVPQKENKCMEERKMGGWTFSISLVLANRKDISKLQ